MILGMTTGLKAKLTESNQVQNWTTINNYRSEWRIIIFKRRYDRCRGNWNLRNCKLSRKKFREFNKIRTLGLCVSAAVLYQLSYEDPYIGSGPICWVHFKPWKKRNMNEDNANWGTTKLNEAMIVAVEIVINRYFQGWHITIIGWFSNRTGTSLTTGKRAKRSKLDFRFPISRSAIGQASCLICARRRQMTFPFYC